MCIFQHVCTYLAQCAVSASPLWSDHSCSDRHSSETACNCNCKDIFKYSARQNINTIQCLCFIDILRQQHAEADLVMLSMFGRTGPHKKGAPQEDLQFLQHRNIQEIIEIIRRRKRFCVHIMRVLNKMSMMTTLSLCVSCEFSRVIRILSRGPTFFSEQGSA